MTNREQRVLNIVRDRIELTGVAPSFSEIASAVGFKSKSNVQQAIDGLVNNGLLIRKPHAARGLSLPDVPNLDAVPTAALRAAISRREERIA